MNPTAALARWAADLRYDDLSADVVARVRGLLLDHLGVAVLGSTRDHHRRWVSTELRMGGGEPGLSTVVGTALRVAPDRAAFLNGVAGSSGPNLDDVWHGSLGHPGVGTFPALLARGEEVRASGPALIEAAVVGYEVTMRIGTALGRSAFDRGWHPRGGCNAAAAAVASLKVGGEQRAEVYQAAIGLAVNAAAGVVGAAYFSDAWYALSGQASREGLLAGLAARAGLRATDEPLAADRGYLAAASDQVDLDSLTDGLGGEPMLMRAGQKLYPSSGATHAALEAAVAARTELGCDAAEIVEINGWGFREMVDVLGRSHPSTALAASMSTPYVVACGVRDGGFDLSHLDSGRIADPELARLQSVTRLVVDDRLDRLPPRHLGARIQLVARDGRQATAEVLAASGHAGNPLGFDRVAGKVRRLLAGRWPEASVDRLVEGAAGLPATDVEALMRAVRLGD
ncbi:MmgE/PrpD family protein [Micromonospora sp. NPDC005257]|uniref:MmgE/PrpD family protein n=1 Tax=Micromonospora sp. NPDC005257 TaxID=3364230 RepID=UPI0036989A27